MADRETLADIDLGLLNVQRNLMRIVVLVSSVLVLQGFILLILAWIADGLVVSIVVGAIGAVVCIVGLLVWIANFRTYGEVALTVDEAKLNHPATNESDEKDSS